MCIDKHVIRCDNLQQARLILSPGDVLEFHRGTYAHWAIVVGVRKDWTWRTAGIEIVHRFGESTSTAAIRVDEFDDVYGSSADDQLSVGLLSSAANISLGKNVTTSLAVHKCTSPTCRDDAIARAKSKIGESGYNLFWRNCEHFVRWCVEGVESSAQVTAGRDRTVAHAVTFAAGILVTMFFNLLLGGRQG